MSKSLLYRSFLKILALTLFTSLLFTLSSCTSKSSSELGRRILAEDPKPVTFTPKAPERIQLKNGITLLYLEDRELPLVSGALYLPRGILWEKYPLKRGSVALMGSMMRAGGTESLNSEALDEKLRQLAAEISTSYGDEFGSASFNCLTNDVDQVFSIFSEVIKKPAFDETRLELAKTQILDSIRRRKDTPDDIAAVTASVLMDGYTPHSGVLTTKDVNSINRLEILKAHRQFVRPNGAYLIITGDITKQKAAKLAEQYFADWDLADNDLGSPVAKPNPGKKGIYFIEGDFNQSLIYAIQNGPPRLNPDMYATRILNGVLGEGMDSRVMRVVRGDLGLVYSVGAVISPGFPTGSNIIYAQTKASTTVSALKATVGEISKMITEAPTEDELDLIKQGEQSSFIFKFTSPAAILSRQVTLELLKFPSNYDVDYLNNVFSVTAEDVVQAAKRWWKLDDLRLVIVGNSEALKIIKESLKHDSIFSSYPIYKVPFNEVPKFNAKKELK